MKTVLILSTEKKTSDWIGASIREIGFDGRIDVLRTDLELLERIQELEHLPPAAVFVDLSDLAHGERLVEWLRLSSRTRRLRIIAVGEESDALRAFRNAWGARAVLTRPLRAAAVEEAVRDLNLGGPKQRRARREARKKLVEAVEKSKALRTEQETLVRNIDLLLAEIKEKKIPFKRARGTKRESEDQTRQRTG